MTDERSPARDPVHDDPSGSSERPPAARLAELVELPERGTGVRAARRAARRRARGQADELDGGVDEWRTALVEHERAASPPPPGAGPAGRAAGEAATAEPPPTEDGRRAARRPSRRWLVAFSTALAACVLAAAGLAWLGFSTLRDSRAGRIVTSAAPDEPGFEGFLEPTPTLAVTVTHQGLLDAVYVLSLSAGDAGGGILLVPPRTRLGDGGTATIDFTYSFGADEEAMRSSIESVAGFGLDELVTIDEARWAELVAPVAPIVIDNPDDLEGFPIGRLELTPAQVGPYLAARAEGESDLSRLARHEVVWEAWLAQVGTTGEVPGELATGLGRFVRGLAAGPHVVRTLPTTELVREDGWFDYRVDEAARARVVTELVPYPRGTASAPRTLVRLLDGTGDQGHVPRIAPTVVGADASIVVVGNADHFDYDTTQIRYHRPEHRRAAERLQEALGAGEVIEDVRPIDSFDVTIVLGTDL